MAVGRSYLSTSVSLAVHMPQIAIFFHLSSVDYYNGSFKTQVPRNTISPQNKIKQKGTA
jgi:hypothetical protein